MARKIVHQLVDDLDGTVLEVGDGETVLFSVDGTAYEIDLTHDNANALRETLAPYIDAARRVSSRPAASRASSSSNSSRKQKRAGQRDYAPIREWAAQNGYELSERGRVPAQVLDAYDAAH
ncbi:histone-like nucleoid-structuring protein Lsr2 [Microbacterium oleivorans]|uniref:LSR2-family protein n=1 Tax=Microbacterium oleivorans TaxID=273677 RepID=A0A031FPP3_9MICO|nr:Lsr2 family protein [Microbacterium oleivorans]AZS44360.1 Nucleoid-associated protein Lsr2 [Microbacterium oleivorans]EZP26809.1 LSR2-family protein [Microbacterium oleivorans]THE08234.1 Lsr2 family protein [Microbacterium oleivorans]